MGARCEWRSARRHRRQGGRMDWLDSLSTTIEAIVVESVALPYVLLLVAACCLVDAVFPVVPSESVLIAVATVSTATVGPSLWSLVLVAAVGAWIGDHLVFHLGRAAGPGRWRWMRRPGHPRRPRRRQLRRRIDALPAGALRGDGRTRRGDLGFVLGARRSRLRLDLRGPARARHGHGDRGRVRGRAPPRRRVRARTAAGCGGACPARGRLSTPTAARWPAPTSRDGPSMVRSISPGWTARRASAPRAGSHPRGGAPQRDR
jgi:hypothetical protein